MEYVTFYRSAEELPEFTDYSMKGRTYRYMENEALYPFGFGLSVHPPREPPVRCPTEEPVPQACRWRKPSPTAPAAYPEGQVPAYRRWHTDCPGRPPRLPVPDIIGPNADNRKALVGNYEGTASRYYTVSEGIQDYVGDGVRVLTAV